MLCVGRCWKIKCVEAGMYWCQWCHSNFPAIDCYMYNSIPDDTPSAFVASTTFWRASRAFCSTLLWGFSSCRKTVFILSGLDHACKDNEPKVREIHQKLNRWCVSTLFFNSPSLLWVFEKYTMHACMDLDVCCSHMLLRANWFDIYAISYTTHPDPFVDLLLLWLVDLIFPPWSIWACGIPEAFTSIKDSFARLDWSLPTTWHAQAANVEGLVLWQGQMCTSSSRLKWNIAVLL